MTAGRVVRPFRQTLYLVASLGLVERRAAFSPGVSLHAVDKGECIRVRLRATIGENVAERKSGAVMTNGAATSAMRWRGGDLCPGEGDGDAARRTRCAWRVAGRDAMYADPLITGLLVGGTYALVAMGLTLQYGVSRILNLANGEILIAAAFAGFWLYTGAAVSPLLGLLVVAPLAFAANWYIYKFLLTPLVRRAKNRGMLEVDSILATFGLLFVFQGIMLIWFGGAYHSYSYLSDAVSVLDVRFGLNRGVAFAAAVLIGAALYVWLYRTRMGVAVRAVAVEPAAAALVAIDVPRTSALAFAVGGTITACGGVLMSMFLTFNASMGVVFTMKALIVTIMGGVGDIRGAVLAGLLLGLAETMVATFVSPNLTLATIYALFLLALVFRPSGLFGRTAR
jgi:branched-chain amino acid transport system permease protein